MIRLELKNCNMILIERSKISALSSGKIHKYEYLIGEEILPSNQQKIIEQAKFTYSPLGKAFEKQIKTIEDQGAKQIKTLQDQGQVKTIKEYTYDDKDTPLISKQKEIFDKPADERLEEITDLDEKVDSNDLIYRYKGRNTDAKFDKYDNSLQILDKMRNGEISLANVKNNQEKFKSNLSEVKKAHQNRTKKQKKTLLQY